jgi:hypothetical protein
MLFDRSQTPPAQWSKLHQVSGKGFGELQKLPVMVIVLLREEICGRGVGLKLEVRVCQVDRGLDAPRYQLDCDMSRYWREAVSCSKCTYGLLPGS